MSKHPFLTLPSVALVCVSTLLTSCVTDSSDFGGGSYPVSARGQAMQVVQAQIISVRPVKLRGESSGLGAVTGAVAGGVVGSMIGHTRGNASTLGALGGALAGGFAGNQIEKSATTARGLEIMVRTPSGQTWNIVQNDHGENFQIGEWVRMLVNGDRRTISR